MTTSAASTGAPNSRSGRTTRTRTPAAPPETPGNRTQARQPRRRRQRVQGLVSSPYGHVRQTAQALLGQPKVLACPALLRPIHARGTSRPSSGFCTSTATATCLNCADASERGCGRAQTSLSIAQSIALPDPETPTPTPARGRIRRHWSRCRRDPQGIFSPPSLPRSGAGFPNRRYRVEGMKLSWREHRQSHHGADSRMAVLFSAPTTTCARAMGRVTGSRVGLSLTAARMTSPKPSPPSLMGSKSSESRPAPCASRARWPSAAAAAVRVPLNLSGTIRTFSVIGHSQAECQG